MKMVVSSSLCSFCPIPARRERRSKAGEAAAVALDKTGLQKEEGIRGRREVEGAKEDRECEQNDTNGLGQLSGRSKRQQSHLENDEPTSTSGIDWLGTGSTGDGSFVFLS